MTKTADKIVMFDADGCLWESQDPMRFALQRETGFLLPFEDWVTSNKIFEIARLLMPRKSHSELFDLLFGDDVLKAAKPTKRTQSFVRVLIEEGFKIVVVTGRPETQLNLTVEMLKCDYPKINEFGVHCRPLNQDSLFHKLFWFSFYKPVCFIDDMIEPLTSIHTVSTQSIRSELFKNSFLALVDKPWNQDIDLAHYPNIFRFGSWQKNRYDWNLLYKKLTSS